MKNVELLNVLYKTSKVGLLTYTKIVSCFERLKNIFRRSFSVL